MNITEITEKQITERSERALPTGLLLHKISFFHTKGNMRVVIQLDKPEDRYGSVNIGECEAYSRALHEELDQLEKSLGVNLNYSLEVSSVGAERELHSVEEIERFRTLPFHVTFERETGKVHSALLKLDALNGETLEFSLANCKQNRKQYTAKKLEAAPRERIHWNQIKKIRLHLDV